jgi:hypothetical protein
MGLFLHLQAYLQLVVVVVVELTLQQRTVALEEAPFNQAMVSEQLGAWVNLGKVLTAVLHGEALPTPMLNPLQVEVERGQMESMPRQLCLALVERVSPRQLLELL